MDRLHNMVCTDIHMYVGACSKACVKSLDERCERRDQIQGAAVPQPPSGICLFSSVAYPDPHGFGTFVWIRIQLKVKKQINKTVNSGLFVL